MEKGSELLARLGGSDDRLVTDARVAVVWRPNIRQLAWQAIVLGGTRVVLDGRMLLETSVAADLAVERDLLTRVQVVCRERTSLHFLLEPPPAHVFVDGESVRLVSGADGVAFTVTAGKHEIELGDFRRPVGRIGPLVMRDLPAVRVSPEAPAFARAVRATASSAGRDALAAIDGDPNTAWATMPGAPGPHWMEVSLPRAVPVNVVRLDPGLACEGRVELYDTQKRDWSRPLRFLVLSDRSEALLRGPMVSTNRIRVTIDETDGNFATLRTLEWREEASSEPTVIPLTTQPASAPHRVTVIIPLRPPSTAPTPTQPAR
jgi:hypothetical protein